MMLSFLSQAGGLSSRGSSDHRRGAKRLWTLFRPRMLVILPMALALLTLAMLGMATRAEMGNSTIGALKSNRDIAADTHAPAEVLLARIEFLLGHDRVDEVQPLVEALDKSGSDKLRNIAHYDYANGRLRQAFDLITRDKLDAAGPFVVLSRQEYRRALTFAPDDWDAKYNFDVGSRLIRDFPAFERTIGDTVRTDRKKIWTDIPGLPEGLP